MGKGKWDSLLTKEYLEEICQIHNRKEIAVITGVPLTTLNNYLKKYNLLPSLVDRNSRNYGEVLTKEFLLTVYPNKQINEIAKIVGCSRATVDKYLAKNGLYRLKKVRKGGYKLSVAEKLNFEYLSSVHSEKTVKEIAKETGCGPSTVRKYLNGFDLTIKNSRVGKMRGARNPNWKGGHCNKSGYVMVHCPRVGKPRREHLVIMEEYIGRPLLDSEVVHHCNGKRNDNSVDNLLLMDRHTHNTFHSICKTFNIDFTHLSKEEVLKFLIDISCVCDVYKRVNKIG
jgi:hypothetical protein